MTPSYLLEAPGEGARLFAKVDPPAWAARYARDLPVDGPVLEVGAGPMHLLEAAMTVTGQPGVGVDTSVSRLQFADRKQPRGDSAVPTPVCAEATRLPFRNGSFGLSYARFVLEYLPDPSAAVLEMARVTRPGGHLLLQDLDGQLILHYPVDPDLQGALETFLSKTRGRFDPNVGRKLFSYARSAGLIDLAVQLEPYHLIAGAADNPTLALWDAKLTHAFPAAADVLGSGLAAHTKQRFLDYLANPDTLTYSQQFTVTGRTRGGL